MAEYNINYEDLKDIIDSCVEKSECIGKDEKKNYSNMILTAITTESEDDNHSKEDQEKLIKEGLEIWENQIQRPDQLIIWNHYIVIKDTVLKFLACAVDSGFIVNLVKYHIWGDTSAQVDFYQSGVSFASGIKDILKSFKKLSIDEMYIYTQVAKNYRPHGQFTLKTLKQWTEMDDDKLLAILKNLIEEQIVSSDTVDGTDCFRFRV